MNSIRTTVIDGHVHVPVTDNLPDGTEVEVVISLVTSEVKLGDGQWDNSPAGIEAWLERYETLEPLDLTEADRGEIAAALQEQKDWEKANFADHAEKLRKLWQ